MRNVLLFDMDGTLIDSKKTIANHFLMALDRMEIVHSTTEELIGENLEIPFKELIAHLGIEMDSLTFDRFIDIYRESYYGNPLEGTSVFNGVEETLASLKQKGYLFALVTGKHIENALQIMNHLGFTGMFEHIQGWEAGLKEKPNPDILLQAIQKMNVPKESCIMIGDSHVDVLAGKALKMPTIAATYGFGKSLTLKNSKPDFFLDSFIDLPEILKQLEISA